MTIKKDFNENLIKFSGKYNSELIPNADMSKFSTIRSGACMEFVCIPKSVPALIAIVKLLNIYGRKYIVIGGCSNTLFVPGNSNIVGISLAGIKNSPCKFLDKEISVAGGASIASVVSKLINNGISSIEGLVGIPGTIGGAISNNAGYKYDIASKLKSIIILDRSGNIRPVNVKEIEFGYRYSSLPKTWIILEATFSANKSSSSKIKSEVKKDFEHKFNIQPLAERTLGSVFKNPKGTQLKAWELISNSGLRGKEIGGAKISDKHSNFIVNKNSASPEDIRALILHAQKVVREQFKIELEPEIEIVEI
ncbi:MAG: UDP-N-acetylmuramate dehydrogenase [Candidatus Omnitrophica bacterium]|nr:UDP-N-acetylmuramate dehydrogenase [Candidatus Omnitrophota bacterium]